MTKTVNGKIKRIGIGEAEYEISQLQDAHGARYRSLLGRDTLTVTTAYGERIRYTGSARDIDALIRGVAYADIAIAD